MRTAAKIGESAFFLFAVLAFAGIGFAGHGAWRIPKISSIAPSHAVADAVQPCVASGVSTARKDQLGSFSAASLHRRRYVSMWHDAGCLDVDAVRRPSPQ
jgi:hypothetical protein